MKNTMFKLFLFFLTVGWFSHLYCVYERMVEWMIQWLIYKGTGFVPEWSRFIELICLMNESKDSPTKTTDWIDHNFELIY